MERDTNKVPLSCPKCDTVIDICRDGLFTPLGGGEGSVEVECSGCHAKWLALVKLEFDI